jgi:hypothetical protein
LATNYLQLFSGATVYEYISGATYVSGWEAYLPLASNVLFALLAGLGLWGMQQRMDTRPSGADACMAVGWFVMLVAFFVVAGASAIAPHFERYGICLIAPGALLLSRGLAWWTAERTARGKTIAVALALCAWLWPIAFGWGYFGVIEHTGGMSHRTFRTGPLEPKLAAWRLIDAARDPAAPSRIECSEWWSYWPMAYLAFETGNVEVMLVEDGQRARSISAEQSDRAWYVEFTDSASERDLLAALTAAGVGVSRTVLKDYAGRPVLSVIGVSGKVFAK